MVAVGLVWPAQAQAAIMCQGEKATIVDTDGRVEGTNGPDVIVGGRDTTVKGRGGDDKVCVAGGFVNGGAGTDSVRVGGPDVAVLARVRNPERLRIQLGQGGQNLVQLSWTSSARGAGTIVGGGSASLDIIAQKSVVADLEDGSLTADGRATYRVTGFDTVHAEAPRVELAGDAQDNDLYGSSCNLVMSGGKGRDFLLADIFVSSPASDDALCRLDHRLLGQRGDDTMHGSGGDDVILGGPGRDRAEGSAGRDRCVAERERDCER